MRPAAEVEKKLLLLPETEFGKKFFWRTYLLLDVYLKTMLVSETTKRRMIGRMMTDGRTSVLICCTPIIFSWRHWGKSWTRNDSRYFGRHKRICCSPIRYKGTGEVDPTFLSRSHEGIMERTYGFTQKGNKCRMPLYVDFLIFLGPRTVRWLLQLKIYILWTNDFMYSSPQYITEVRGHFHVPTVLTPEN